VAHERDPLVFTRGSDREKDLSRKVVVRFVEINVQLGLPSAPQSWATSRRFISA
jgi:hypothetical protein